ncbi:hypothetical protein ACJDUG_13975 [Clostridium sp. WILCCON 0185]|uniref:Oxaloacetate decarboxylase, gamma chain n=1 Tax=Candidatus Clostridium stratigraminis TaxID=3381661 RepID=A0ABW8T6H2_9CLOT
MDIVAIFLVMLVISIGGGIVIEVINFYLLRPLIDKAKKKNR